MTEVRGMRVILWAGCFSEAEAMLTLATALAAEAGATLEGILVEEETGLALASLGATRFVDPAGRTIAQPGRDRMRAAYARDAARFERLLSDTAATASLNWSFRRAGEHSTKTLAAFAGPGDLLVLPARPIGVSFREILLDPDTDNGLAPLARSTAARLGRPLRLLGAARQSSKEAGSVLFTTLPPGGLAKLASAAHCARVFRV
ncbi:MAG: hypothetical protein ACP5EN_03155 [Rhodovulum sp.]